MKSIALVNEFFEELIAKAINDNLRGSDLLKAIPENFKYIKQDKFVLREDGDLYIN